MDGSGSLPGDLGDDSGVLRLPMPEERRNRRLPMVS